MRAPQGRVTSNSDFYIISALCQSGCSKEGWEGVRVNAQTVLTGIYHMEKTLIVNNDGPWDLSAMRKERKQDW